MNIQKQLWLILSIACMGLVLFASFFNISTVKSTVYIGIAFLILTLVPIHFKKWAQYRRDFGIVAGILLIVHGLLAFKTYFNFSIPSLFGSRMFSGTLAALVLFIMLVTSNFGIQRKLKGWWRVIHAVVWFAVPLSLVHAIMAGSAFTGETPILAVLTLGGILIFTFIKPILPGSNQKESFRDMGLAIAGVLVAFSIYSYAPVKPPTPQVKTNTIPRIVSPIDSITSSPTQEASSPLTVPSPTEVQTAPASNTFTLADVVKHNAQADCYVAFQGKVYDVTTYLPMHPGGAEKAARKCGQSLDEFDSMHSGGSFASDVIQAILRPLSIGSLQ